MPPLQLPADLDDRLRRAAHALGIGPGEAVRAAVRAWIEDAEAALNTRARMGSGDGGVCRPPEDYWD